MKRHATVNTLLPPILCWITGLIMMFHPTLLSGLAFMQTDPGDTRLNNYFLEHAYLWINGVKGHQEFWNMPFFYPEKNIAAFSDILLGVAPFYWLWRGLSFAPDTSYQMWLLTITSLNYFSFYLVLTRQFRIMPLSASFGAFLFAFGCSRTSSLYHSQLISQFYAVIAVSMLVSLFRYIKEDIKPHVRSFYISLFFAAITLQMYSGFYSGWFFVFALFFAFVSTLLISDYRTIFLLLMRRHIVIISSSILVSIIFLQPMIQHYLVASQTVGLRMYSDISGSVPTTLAWFSMGSDNWFLGWSNSFFNDSGYKWGHIMGVGFITCLLSLLGIWGARDQPFSRILLLVTLILIALSTQFPGGFTFWQYIYSYFPGAKAIRAVSRISLLLLIPASFGLAFFLHKVQKKRTIVTMLLGILCMLEQGTTTSSFEKNIPRKRIASLVSQINSDCESFLLTIPGNRQFLPKYHLDAMWAEIETGIPTINGYSGNSPRGWYFASIVDLNESNQALVQMALAKWLSSRGLNKSKTCHIIQS